MDLNIVTIDCNTIRDWQTFHDEFKRVFGFPDFYGNNMNAWIDCMTSLSDSGSGMTRVHSKNGQPLILVLKHAAELKRSNHELYEAILENSAFVNHRLMEVGEPPVLTLSYDI